MQLSNLLTAGALRRSLPCVFGLSLCLLLWHELQALDWNAVTGAFAGIPAWRWGAAVLATGLSFVAIAQYDVLAHRQLRSGCPDGVARCAGAAAIALGQTTGFGPAVGAAVRWRLLPDLGHRTLLGLTTLVTLSFLAAWALLTGTLALPVLTGHPWLALPAFVTGALMLCALLLFVPHLRLAGQRIDLPSLPGMSRMVLLAGADMGLAALALYLLLPPDSSPSLPWLTAAYALALGAGLVGGTPGGVGPFDLTLLTLLPATAAPDLAAALLAFRMVYYALPCLLGAGFALLARAPSARPAAPRLVPRAGPRAELAIAAQGDARLVARGAARATALRTPQSLMLFLGPVAGSILPLLPALKAAAREENRLPCLYKITARDAVRLRRSGWRVKPLAVEAVIHLQRHSLSGPDHRQLRRFMRKAAEAGISVRRLTDPDWPALAAIHSAWEQAHGAERGLTMGRFCPLYLADKPLYCAFLDGEPVAFASWLTAPGTLSLDLMRYRPGLPTGVMHSLIQATIEDARELGLATVNLAAVPHPALPGRLCAAEGLIRFKASFAPRWRPLYFAAPSAASLALCAIDIRRSILQPDPLPHATADRWHLDALLDPARPQQDPDRRLAG